MSVRVHRFQRIRFGPLVTAWKCPNCGIKARDISVVRKLEGQPCR